MAASTAAPPALKLRGAITQKIASSPSLAARLRARRYGWNRLCKRPPTLELYYEAGDPHSHLCAQLLAPLQARLNTEIRIHIVGEPQSLLYPEAQRQRAFALQDAQRIAPAWGLQFPANAQRPDTPLQHAATAQLLPFSGGQDVAGFVQREAVVMAALWSGQLASGKRMVYDDARLQQANRRRLQRGHYLPAMWQFDGEWFWGVDRLQHLEARLRDWQLLAGTEPLARFDASLANLPQLQASTTALEFFFSFRSPYSYLAAMQVQALQPRLALPLQIRPVLPMAMRGLKVPAAKRLYIVRDVYREAAQLEIPFGRIADPLGAGAERCLSLYPQAMGLAQQLAFITQASTAVWSQAVDVATDAGLRYVCEQAGLDWTQAQTRLQQQTDLSYAEDNRKALFAAGYWGVPTFRLGHFATWGRDRLWMIEEILRRSGQMH